ncbi:FAD-dependent oxidoreductase [Actinoplanes friuliensis]|uniref:FAD-binding monooxygenase protein n=1 Tax=Actinoplanes friuliensis DSM 7358 TaxID=1246995 RepID=U5W0Y7_9ACTN|nr:NAD(P)/FAD-dependent oxidoreductase [Actinoplanes friuliensis]AGZ42809.1 FAD-binding monooxygenase protein [Actinoplanes friuliensis DSM 7358]
MTDLDVMIIGGGIGGLALAQGLRRAGITTHVYERTHERTDWLQGYRIHISPAGARALRDCLGPEGWQAFLDTAAPGGGFGFLDDRGRELLAFTEEEIGDRHFGISRTGLREVLLRGPLHTGKTFVGYEETGDHVTARFADGSTATAGLLIGADGANSRVRAQLLPHAHRVDTGVVAVAGRYPLSAGALPPALTGRAALVVPRGHGSLFTAVSEPDGYVLWGFSDATTRFPDGADKLAGPRLQQLVAERIRSWSPGFRRLVDGSDPATINAFRVRSASPVDPWPTRRVTLLGDAIHNMTPMAGVGANTALRDADLLRRKLIGEQPLLDAVAEYEREMLGYGFAAVRLSLRNARSVATSTRLSRAGFRGVLRLTNAVPPLRLRMARGLGR